MIFHPVTAAIKQARKPPSWQRIIYQGAKLDKKIQLSAYSAIFLQILHYFIKVLPIFTDRTFVISLRF